MSVGGSVFLLVEDNEDDVYFMRRAFRNAGLQNRLQVVNNGEEALDYFEGRDKFGDRKQYPLPDLVFLDLKMPGLTGFDVLRSLRKELKVSTPVAVLTSSPEEVDYKRARELGADCYLLKPPTSELLLSCCKQFTLDCRQ